MAKTGGGGCVSIQWSVRINWSPWHPLAGRVGRGSESEILGYGLKTVVHMSTLLSLLDGSYSVVRRALLTPSSLFGWRLVLLDLYTELSNEAELYVIKLWWFGAYVSTIMTQSRDERSVMVKVAAYLLSNPPQLWSEYWFWCEHPL